MDRPVRYLSVREYAELLGMATSTVYKAVEEGTLAHVRVRRAIRIALGVGGPGAHA